MKKKIFSWLSVFFVAALCIGFASCGGGDDDDDDNTGQTTGGNNNNGNLPEESRFLVGTWEIRYDGATKETERWLTLSADGNAVMVINKYTMNFSGSHSSGEWVWTPKSSQKLTGNWKYVKWTDDFGQLITDIAGWNEIDVSGRLENYWRGFNNGTSSYFNADKMPEDDNAVNHMVTVGNTWIKCNTCNGNKKCISCEGSGKCAYCKGTGSTGTQYFSTCFYCSGTGKCSKCSGNGNCPDCNGQGGHYE